MNEMPFIFGEPDASATTRGVVNITTQTFAGDKTFTGNVTISGTLTAIRLNNPAENIIAATLFT